MTAPTSKPVFAIAPGSGDLPKLVLVAPAPADGFQSPPGVHERALALRKAQDREALLRERKALSPRDLPEDQLRRAVERKLSVSDAHHNESLDSFMSSARGDLLREMNVPTLMIAGAADSLLPANLDDFRRLPHATLHVFSRVGHNIPAEVPGEFATVVADFLEHGVVTAATLRAAMIAATPAR